MASRPFLQEEFENEFGQVIKPGDSVVAISQGYNHSVKIRMGIYLGLRMQRWGDKSKVDHVVVRVKGKRYGMDPSTGKYGYHEHEFITRLPNCRIYPSAIPLSEFAGKSL